MKKKICKRLVIFWVIFFWVGLFTNLQEQEHKTRRQSRTLDLISGNGDKNLGTRFRHRY